MSTVLETKATTGKDTTSAIEMAVADANGRHDETWEHTLQNLGVYTPATLVDAAKSRAQQPELVEGLIRQRSVNLLVGDSGLGKTPLGIQLGVCVAAGVPFLNLKVTERAPVLYCDAETDLRSFVEMLQAISDFTGLSAPPPDFHIWSPNWNSSTDSREAMLSWADQISTRVQVVKPTLVIVDPLRMFWPKAETGNEDAVQMITTLRKLSRAIGSTWVITHHKRKVNQQVNTVRLEDNPLGWFQEAAGAHALVNQTDTRLGLVPHTGQADLLLAGFMRGTGPFVPFDLARVNDDNGTPIGYRLLTGVEHLNPVDRATYEKLENRFRFKDALALMGGASDSNTTRFVKRCCSLQIAKKDGNEYVKTDPEGGVRGVRGVASGPLLAPSAPSTPFLEGESSRDKRDED